MIIIKHHNNLAIPETLVYDLCKALEEHDMMLKVGILPAPQSGAAGYFVSKNDELFIHIQWTNMPVGISLCFSTQSDMGKLNSAMEEIVGFKYYFRHDAVMMTLPLKDRHLAVKAMADFLTTGVYPDISE